MKHWDFLREYKQNKKYYLKKIDDTILSKSLILGKQVELFEKNASKYVGCKYGIGVNSGTDALVISLMALNIKKGDEIITTSNTAIPTISAIVTAGAKPVYIDIKDNYLVNEDLIEKNISKKTKAIIIVHLYGQSPNMEKILKISKKFNIRIIEDCAQSFGAKYKKKKLGSFGSISAFSFYPTKILGTFGDGGLISTNDKKIYEKCKMLRFYGIKNNYISEFHGVNSRLDEIHAAILNLKLNKINQSISKRRKIANFYKNNLKNNIIKLPEVLLNNYHVFYNYVIRTKKRNALKKYLLKNNIETKIIYPYPVHKMKYYSKFKIGKPNLNNTEKIYKEILSLPIYPEISIKELKKIAYFINSFR